MALFGNSRESQRMAAMRETQKPEEELEMLIEYYDHSIDTISITYNNWLVIPYQLEPV